MIDIDALQTRKTDLINWLAERERIVNEQRHLDEGSVERIYWNYGYAVALGDILKMNTLND